MHYLQLINQITHGSDDEVSADSNEDLNDCTVFLPLSTLHQADAPSLPVLRSRIKATAVLPQGMYYNQHSYYIVYWQYG